MKMLKGLRPVPYASRLIEVEEIYLHVPVYDPSLKEPDDWWLLSLTPDSSGDDLLLEQVAMRRGEVVYEVTSTVENIRKLLDSTRKNGSPDKDTLTYRSLADAILMKRAKIGEALLAEKKEIEYQEWTQAWGRQSRPYSKRCPVFYIDDCARWQLKMSPELNDYICEYKWKAPAILSVEWNDVDGLKKAVETLNDTTKWRSLEIQESLLALDI